MAKLAINDEAMMIQGSNFIYGHIAEVLNDGKQYKLVPDMGYHTSKPFFKLKEYYIVDEDKVEPIHASDKEESTIC